MTRGTDLVAYKSPLHEMTHSSPTALWNNSVSIRELTYSIKPGAVGATCNPVIVRGVLKQEMDAWKNRIRTLIEDMTGSGEGEIAWQLVRDISANGAALVPSAREPTNADRRSAAQFANRQKILELVAG